ncbi:MAG: hypothetical protein J0M07_09455 [Anaerolineae bacterium]|nr:hypothetical protein [Anaerolineae bacterium]
MCDDSTIVHNGEVLEQEVHRLRRQLENLQRAHQGGIASYLEQRALLVDEITRLKQAVTA